MTTHTCTQCEQEAERLARRKDFRDNLIAHALLASIGIVFGFVFYFWLIGAAA